MSRKRPVVEFNEDRLKMMMAGDIPIEPQPSDILSINGIPQNQEVVEQSREEGSQEESLQKVSFEVESNRSGKRKKTKPGYEDIFLSNVLPPDRKSTSIALDKENYMNILVLLKTTNRLSVAAFINNVLTHHFEVFHEEIDRIRKSFIEKYKNYEP